MMKKKKYRIKIQRYYYNGHSHPTYMTDPNGRVIELDTIPDAHRLLTSQDDHPEALWLEYHGNAVYGPFGRYELHHNEYAAPEYLIVLACNGIVSREIISECERLNSLH